MNSSEGIRDGASRRPHVNRRGSHPALRLVAAVPFLILGGCGLDQWAHNGFKVGPNYTPPPAPVAEHWIDYQRPEAQTPAQSAELNQWWRVFNDPVLNSLVSDAYRQNLSLRVAGERIAEARAVRGIAVGNMFPQTQEMAGGYTANKASAQNASPAPQQWFNHAEAGFNMSWELDFWGRFRRSIEAADANLEASIANYDDVLVVLLADVAANYIQYRTFQERLVLAQINVKIQEAAYQLASDNFKFGKSTERDPQMAKQVLEQTRSSVPEFEAGVRRSNNALCVLLGVPPRELAERLGETGTIPTGHPEWSAGIPADLLRRRPDVRRAEREAAAQSAAIGIAKSDLYPRFSLIGSLGVQAEEIGYLGKTPGSLAGFGGPAFQWNILNYGRIESAVQVQEARFGQLFYQYQGAVLKANREVEDALITYFKSRERLTYLSLSVTAAQRTVEITRDQYQQGAVDFTPVFIFEAALTSQQDSQAQARSDIALSLVDLYRSLGGGWDAKREAGAYDAPVVSAPTTRRTATTMPTTMKAPSAP